MRPNKAFHRTLVNVAFLYSLVTIRGNNGRTWPRGAPDTLCQFPGLYNSRTHLPVPYHSVSPLTYEYCFVHPWLCTPYIVPLDSTLTPQQTLSQVIRFVIRLVGLPQLPHDC